MSMFPTVRLNAVKVLKSTSYHNNIVCQACARR